ncbi:YegS/Rv2252/BmrU family lipid kinase [Lentilactobacillus senioris]|uniref:diacylglycerol/lipid kinase family protein n=1 Tax=Lentilactobacillus senioris TaxID=931534 RepID=UPI00227E0014|nr:YegS/Rv2252/BmrU family lipid kinase [Lentilactobacillus senioris]MCY9807243.1 YegS/Rv2252/BmrU family lipid kinase [Lentilactobacillus senioris]
MMKYTVLYNQSAGKADSEKRAQQFKVLAQATQHKVVLVGTTSREQAIKYIQENIDNIKTLVVVGGDGSINTVFSALISMKASPVIGILPGGTVNNFARAMNIPLDNEKATKVILNGKGITTDLLHSDQRAIASSLTLGTVAEMAKGVRQEEKQRWGSLTYLVNGIKKLVTTKPASIQIKAGEQIHQFNTRFLLITTTSSIGGFTKFNPEVGVDDHQIHITILKRFSPWRIMGYFSYFITGQIRKLNDASYLKLEQANISSLDDKKVAVRIDGDEAGELPVNLYVKKQFIKIIVPESD